MEDFTKTIEGLQLMHDMEAWDERCNGEPAIRARKKITADALELLERFPRDKSPVRPICEIMFDVPYYFCGECKTMLNMYGEKARFCSKCGRAVE